MFKFPIIGKSGGPVVKGEKKDVLKCVLIFNTLMIEAFVKILLTRRITRRFFDRKVKECSQS